LTKISKNIPKNKAMRNEKWENINFLGFERKKREVIY
jgi:hypothetical protein